MEKSDFDEFVKQQAVLAGMEPEVEPKEIGDDFDPELFKKPPAEELVKRYEAEIGERATTLDGEVLDIGDPATGICPYAPRACAKVNTSRCDKKCDHNPDHYMDAKIKEVFEKEPWSNYCFTCGEFVPSRRHEDMCDPQELIGSHTVATGFNEYRVKLSQWTLERLTGKKLPEEKPVDWKNTL
jgi:hypothetical protein